MSQAATASNGGTIMRAEQTLRLIQLYHEHYPDIARNNQDADGRSTKTLLWAQITDELNAAFETLFTVEQFKKKVQNVQCTSRQKLYSGKRNLGEAEVEYLRLFETDKIPAEVLLQRAKSRRSQSVLIDSLSCNDDDAEGGQKGQEGSLDLLSGEFKREEELLLEDFDGGGSSSYDGESNSPQHNDDQQQPKSSPLFGDAVSTAEEEEGVCDAATMMASAQQLLMAMVANAPDFLNGIGNNGANNGTPNSHQKPLHGNKSANKKVNNNNQTQQNHSSLKTPTTTAAQSKDLASIVESILGHHQNQQQQSSKQQQKLASAKTRGGGGVDTTESLGLRQRRRKPSTTTEQLQQMHQQNGNSVSKLAKTVPTSIISSSTIGNRKNDCNSSTTSSGSDHHSVTEDIVVECKPQKLQQKPSASSNDQQQGDEAISDDHAWKQQMLKAQEQILCNQQSLIELLKQQQNVELSGAPAGFLHSQTGGLMALSEQQPQQKSLPLATGDALSASLVMHTLCGKLDTMNNGLKTIADAINLLRDTLVTSASGGGGGGKN